MKKLINITLLGLCLLVAGIIMITSEKVGVNNAKVIVPALFALAGVLSILFSTANKEVQVASKFQLIEGIGLIVFSVVIAFMPESLQGFLMYVTYFMLMFGLLEVIFSFSVLNSKTKIIKEMLIYRIIAGVATAIGAIVLLLTTFSDEYKGLMVAGALTALIGLSNIIFASKVKKLNTTE